MSLRWHSCSMAVSLSLGTPSHDGGRQFWWLVGKLSKWAFNCPGNAANALSVAFMSRFVFMGVLDPEVPYVQQQPIVTDAVGNCSIRSVGASVPADCRNELSSASAI